MWLRRIADLDDDEQLREVYARFGLTVYVAQVLEHGMTNLIVVSEAIEGRYATDEEINQRFDELFEQVLGRLVRRLEQDERLDEDGLALCRRALAERNRLTHRYWREEVAEMTTDAGRQRMLNQLDAARDLFHQADAVVDAALFRLGSAYGITPESVDQVAAQQRAEAAQSGDIARS